MKTNRDEAPAPRLIQASRWGELGPGWPSSSGLRHLIHKAATNGFDAVIRRVGRVVLVDVDAFHVWVSAQNSAATAERLPHG